MSEREQKSRELMEQLEKLPPKAQERIGYMIEGALVLLALAVVLAGLGSCAEQEEDEKPCKERQPQEKRAADRRKAG